MARVLLVTYSGYIKTPSSLALDNGLANLAGALVERGHWVRIEDFNTLTVLEKMTPPSLRELSGTVPGGSFESLQELFDQQQNQAIDDLFRTLEQSIRRERIDVIGFKCWGSEGATAIKEWCRRIRSSFPKIKILLGGPMCEIMPEHMAKFVENFDFMAVHEAEVTIAGLMDHIESGLPIERVAGVLYPIGEGYKRTASSLVHDLDELPWPNYDEEVYPTAWSGEKLNLVVLDESRGCPMNCHFCVHPSYAGSWRVKSTGRLIAEIEHIQAKLKTRYFRFAGSNTPPALLRSLCREIVSRDIDMRFSCFMHVNTTKKEMLPEMQRAGLRCVFYGIETADEELLARVGGKRIALERSREILKATSEQKIFTTGSFMFPLPFETGASRLKTKKFITEVFGNNRYASAQFLNPAPLPHTRWWTNRQDYGFEFEDDPLLFETITLPIRHMFPPELQQFLPYKIQGKSHRELACELGVLMKELEPENVIFNVSDDVAIIACGSGRHPADLRSELLPAFMYGDVEKIREMVKCFNDNLCRQGRAVGSIPQPEKNAEAMPRL